MNETLTDEVSTDGSTTKDGMTKTGGHNHKNGENCKGLHLTEKRFCYSCQIWRPAFASHCNTWNHCIKGFDHHWMVTNWWIGERNLRNFVLSQFYLGSAVFIGVYAIYSFYDEAIKDLSTNCQNEYKKNFTKIIGFYLWGLVSFAMAFGGKHILQYFAFQLLALNFF